MLRSKLRATMTSKLRAAIIIVSETASKDATTDKCIPALQQVFQQDGGDQWEQAETKIVADDVSAIRNAIKAYTDSAENANLVVTSGGTGFALKDVTPEVSSRSPHCEDRHQIYNEYARNEDRTLTMSGCHPSYPEACPWAGSRYARGVSRRHSVRRHVSPGCRRPKQHPHLDTSRFSQRRQREPTVRDQAAAPRMSANCGHGLACFTLWRHREART